MEQTLAFLRERAPGPHRVLLVLGSGLGAFADEFEPAVRLSFNDIPGFAPTRIEGHKGLLVTGLLEGVPCLALQGRYHIYEGHSAEAVTVPIRAAAALGVDTMIVTNAAGGLNRAFCAGDLMIIEDHINLMWQNPLIGPVRAGEPRFPDMSAPYDRGLQALADRVGLERGIALVRGTYLALSGPAYETPAEVRAFQRFGADAVGMSTVPEVTVARALGMRVLGISLIANAAAGLTPEMVLHEDVIAAGVRTRASFTSLVRGVLAALSSDRPKEPSA